MMRTMKNLVIAVSPDSSLDLLARYADVVVLDKNPIKTISALYDTVYIRSHFSQQATLPQNFRSEIENLAKQARGLNPVVRFIDGMDNVDAIVAFEDKWLQYKTFADFMPRTELCDENLDISDFVRPIYKNRLSSRGSGVTWDRETTLRTRADWIIQESLDIKEELRVYIIRGEVCPVGTVKQSMTEGNKAEGVGFRELTQDEINFSKDLIEQASNLDLVGADIARSTNGELRLLEANRSPGFARFYELTGINIANLLYKN